MLERNCVRKDSWESLTLQGYQASQFLRKSVLNIPWKDWCWSWNSNILATWCKEPTHWKSLWCWERLRAGGEQDDREWDGWMASLSQWTRVWAIPGRLWRAEKPGMLQSMESQRVRHNLVTEQQITNRGYRWSIQLLSSGDQCFPFERLPSSGLLDVIFSWVSS